MEIAIICLGYLKSATGAALLADYFADWADFYIHIDAKSDISPYSHAAATHANIRLAERRFPIFWGGFNTIRACVTTIEQALRAKNYDRIAFITEDTIPLVGRSEFLRCMSEPTEWIQTYRSTNEEWIARYRGFYFFDSLATNPRHVPPLDRRWTTHELASLKRLEALQQRGKANIELMFGGGTWWCLSRAQIDKFLLHYHANDHVRESFEFSAIPEEQYIHTVLGSLAESRTFVHTDWSRDPRPYVFQSIDEISSLDARGAPMLRKVALDVPEIETFVRSLARC
ncbi:beta-1,6-N-acetylglucosaminyltransferase [Xanthobacter autotrophicus DSM 597]|uniref:beta-1,6-N-acetylglucosaminyltransferase n=1 Tax=Xanthobacter TaxID=279 RepID=UPI001AE44625|nr:beta-1,6-N-acetylglucosaminyltransferase [Xanthobacter flavus]MBP2151726.1 hypothetical protein [Xanthobacter flavus]